jgi:hypothetical protein
MGLTREYHGFMIRGFHRRSAWFAAGILAVALGTGTAGAQTNKPKPSSSAKPAPAKPAAAPAKPAPPGAPQPLQLASFGDWGAYASETAKGKVCYALSQPKERLPAGLNRDPGYLFISTRPSEGVRNEVSVVVGFPTKDGADAEAVIGNNSFTLVTKGNSAWMKNAAEDPTIVEAMKKGSALVLKTTSRKGNINTDRYSLSGFAQALDRVKKDCP